MIQDERPGTPRRTSGLCKCLQSIAQADLMRRRDFGAALGGVTFLSMSARGQDGRRPHRLALLSFQSPDNPALVAAFVGLRSLGFVEGGNLAVDRTERGLGREQLAAATQRAVESTPDVVMAAGPFIKAAQSATRTIPIVGMADDMVGEGYVASLARQGGNTTGVSILATELDGKRQEILMEVLPRARRIAMLGDAGPSVPAHFSTLETGARKSGVELSLLRLAAAEDVQPALEQAKAGGAEAINVLASPILFALAPRIFSVATALRLPTMYQWPEGLGDGALLAYGPGFTETFRQWGLIAGRVLRGAKPGDLPVVQPTIFKLAINLRLARELGIMIPAAILQRADEVIE